LKALLQEGGALAATALSPVIDRRLGTIAAVLMPFSRDEYDARNVAMRTNSYQTAAAFPQEFNALSYTVYSPQQIITAAERIAAVLAEVVKDSDGDLVQFLDRSPVAAVTSSESDTPAAPTSSESDTPAAPTSENGGDQ
jgi:hypothetical protein